MPTALVTGASAGIGAAFVRRLTAYRFNLVLVARDADRLAQVAGEASARGVEAETLPADLVTDEGCAAVEARLTDAGRPIDMLVNSAGIGLRTAFVRSTLADEERMLRLNVGAILRLTHAVLPKMVERGRGDIINLSSVAGFGPTSPGGTYSATKAWVTNFSESLHIAHAKDGVRVLALCPGFVHTEWHQRAGIDTDQINKHLWLDADDVARTGLADLRKGHSVSVPSARFKVLSGLIKHVPRPVFNRVIGGNTRGLTRRSE